jgi:hypothetical protein
MHPESDLWKNFNTVRTKTKTRDFFFKKIETPKLSYGASMRKCLLFRGIFYVCWIITAEFSVSFQNTTLSISNYRSFSQIKIYKFYYVYRYNIDLDA